MNNILSNEASLRLLDKVGHEAPKPGAWGIATRDSATGGFWWFKNQDTLMDFITRALPTIELTHEEINDFEGQIKIHHNLISKFKEGSHEPLFIVHHHNQHFKGDIELVWIGAFDELVMGNSSFSKFIRQEFHENENTIQKKEVEEFKEFVGEDVPYLSQYEDLDTKFTMASTLSDNANSNPVINDNCTIVILELTKAFNTYAYPLYGFADLKVWKEAFPFFAFFDINSHDEIFPAIVDVDHLSLYRETVSSPYDFDALENFRKSFNLQFGDTNNIFFIGSISDILEKRNESAELIFNRWKEDEAELTIEKFLTIWNELYLA